MNRAILKANNGCLRVAKQKMMRSKQATPGEETTKLIQAKLLRDDMFESKSARNWHGRSSPVQERDSGEMGHGEERC